MVEEVFDKERVPWQLGRPGCGAVVFTGIHGQPRDCTGRVMYAGVVLSRRGRPPRWECWLAFACDVHREQIDAPRPLLARDEAVRARWREQDGRALDGQPNQPPGPLALGREARELHTRAMAWVARAPQSPDR